jgi:proline dehydrogenase
VATVAVSRVRSFDLRHALLEAGANDRVRDTVLSLPMARRFAGRFVAGETRAQALAAVRQLRAEGIRATVDYLGENVGDRAAAERIADEYEALLGDFAAHGLDTHVSVKLTALGLDVDEELCLAGLGRIAARALANDSFVRIDMEGSAYTARTLAAFRRIRSAHPNVGLVLQAYLRRTAADVEEMIRLGARVRLCKGAYDEPPEIAFPEKANVDANYMRLAERLLDAGDYPALATHDSKMIQHAIEHAKSRAIGPERFEFQMLYGIARPLQRRLVDAGHNLRVYVPYGTEWYGYFLRRLAERPANLLFFLTAALRR